MRYSAPRGAAPHDYLPHRPGDVRLGANVGIPWEVKSEQRRIPVPTRPDYLSDVEHRDRTHHGHPKPNPARDQGIFGTSVERDFAEQQRKAEAAAARRQATADRVLAYATNKQEHVRNARADCKVALDAHVQAAERARAAEQRSRLLQDRQALAHAAAQEQGIQQRADARKTAAAAVAAENLQLIEARRAQARAQHFTAQRGCDDDGSFFERFGQSLS